MQLSSLALTLVALATPITPVAATPQEWERITPELELEFPRDHGAHPYHQTEWWYITGQLETEGLAGAAPRQFGFQFTIFRRGLAPGWSAPGQSPAGGSPLRARQVFAGHLALTDVAGDRTLFVERIRRAGSPLAHASDTDLELVLEDWTLSRDTNDRLQIVAGDAQEGLAIELELTPRKALVLHGKGGYSSKGNEAGNASAYTSWTRLETSGRVAIGGEDARVRGEAWFDHEYGTSVLEEGVSGWDWFGLHLEDGRELMLFELRAGSEGAEGVAAGTLIERDGSTRSLAPGDFTVESIDTWKSPDTAATYPAHWRVRVPSAGIAFEARPLVANCELKSDGSTNVAYWEGPVVLEGTTPGRGYAELTGYAGSMEGRF